MFTYGLLGASLVGLLGLQTGQVPGTHSGTKEPQGPQVTTFQVKAAVHYVELGYHFNLVFTGSFTDPTDFDKGIQVTGIGEGIYRPGANDKASVIRDITVVLELSSRVDGVTTQQLARGDRLVYAPAVPSIQLLHIQPMSDGGARALVASVAARTVSEFEVSPSLVRAVHPDKVAAVVAELFRHLRAGSGEAGGMDGVECNPNFTQCADTATRTCAGQGGVCSLSYECIQETGAVKCSFTCCGVQPPPGGG
ncbi:MAG: hypothetical protein AB1601_03900 [Planctomycetota bacterium]